MEWKNSNNFIKPATSQTPIKFTPLFYSMLSVMFSKKYLEIIQIPKIS